MADWDGRSTTARRMVAFNGIPPGVVRRITLLTHEQLQVIPWQIEPGTGTITVPLVGQTVTVLWNVVSGPNNLKVWITYPAQIDYESARPRVNRRSNASLGITDTELKVAPAGAGEVLAEFDVTSTGSGTVPVDLIVPNSGVEAQVTFRFETTGIITGGGGQVIHGPSGGDAEGSWPAVATCLNTGISLIVQHHGGDWKCYRQIETGQPWDLVGTVVTAAATGPGGLEIHASTLSEAVFTVEVGGVTRRYASTNYGESWNEI